MTINQLDLPIPCPACNGKGIRNRSRSIEREARAHTKTGKKGSVVSTKETYCGCEKGNELFDELMDQFIAESR